MNKDIEGSQGHHNPNTPQYTTTLATRRRGRPKKIMNKTIQVHEPNIIVDDHNEEDEAMNTWRVGKLEGMQCNNDQEVVSTLRRSKRKN